MNIGLSLAGCFFILQIYCVYKDVGNKELYKILTMIFTLTLVYNSFSFSGTWINVLLFICLMAAPIALNMYSYWYYNLKPKKKVPWKIPNKIQEPKEVQEPIEIETYHGVYTRPPNNLIN